MLLTKKTMCLTTKLKIEKFLEKIVIESIEPWKNMLLKGDLYNYEKVLSESLAEVHNFISELLLGICSEELSEPLKEKGKKDGVKKMIQRPLSIRISTGYTIKVPSIYAKKVKKKMGRFSIFASKALENNKRIKPSFIR